MSTSPSTSSPMSDVDKLLSLRLDSELRVGDFNKGPHPGVSVFLRNVSNSVSRGEPRVLRVTRRVLPSGRSSDCLGTVRGVGRKVRRVERAVEEGVGLDGASLTLPSISFSLHHDANRRECGTQLRSRSNGTEGASSVLGCVAI